ncbi:MAG TPA: metallophosphoesterase family protein [Vicinamibacterales bacterium]|mgnify:CR=1 FL=1|nr:metallophosphoesterase family protein [Vicinamibacterales bacterium]
MRYLVISDIHANLQAYDTVMAAAGRLGWDRAVVLGDLVGYGADPNAVVERVRALQPHAVIRGNHDKVGSGLETPEGFNAVARSAIHWTHDALTDDNRAWLAGLATGPIIVDEAFEICHGTPFDEDAYVFDDLDALRAVHAARRALCFFGHTHVQVGYSLRNNQFVVETDDEPRPFEMAVASEARYLVNPGSVGQPRDGDPRAGFGVVDVEAGTVTLHRVAYPVAEAQARIAAEGLPEILAERLGVGR